MCAVFEKVQKMEPKMTPTHQRLELGRASGPTSPRASGSSLWSDCGMALDDHAQKKTAGALTQHRTFVYNNHTYIYIYIYIFMAPGPSPIASRDEITPQGGTPHFDEWKGAL